MLLHTSRLIATAPPTIHKLMARRIARRFTMPMDTATLGVDMRMTGTIAGDDGRLVLYRVAAANLVTSSFPAMISCSADFAASSALGGIFASRAGL